jgi:hypothetical protein
MDCLGCRRHEVKEERVVDGRRQRLTIRKRCAFLIRSCCPIERERDRLLGEAEQLVIILLLLGITNYTHIHHHWATDTVAS